MRDHLPPPPDPEDPHGADLSRRSKVAATGSWVWFALLILFGIGVYVLSSL